MEYNQVKEMKLDLDIFTSETEVLALRTLKRVRQLKNLKDRESMIAAEMLYLEELETYLRSRIDDREQARRRNILRNENLQTFDKPDLRDCDLRLDGWKQDIENINREYVAVNVGLYMLENKYPKYVERIKEYDLPEYYNETLLQYEEKLQRFMETNWKQQAGKNKRIARASSLIECMQMLGQSNELINKAALDKKASV